MQVAPHMITFSRAATAASELFSLIERQSKINPFDKSGDTPDETAGFIDVHGINFSYPTRPDVTVLEDFTLSIPAGKVTALVVSSLSDCNSYPSLKGLVNRGGEIKRGHPVQEKARSLACSNDGIPPVQAASLWMARTSVSSTSSGCGPTSG